MKLSVIMPVYNVKKYLRQAVNSVLKTKHEDIEVILVENGSNDGSEILCDEISRIDKRVKVFHIKSKGVSYARNYGLSVAQGEWIIFIDSDDWFEDNAIEKLYKCCDEQNYVDIICFNAYRAVCKSGEEFVEKIKMRDISPDNYLIKSDKKNELACSLMCSLYKNNFYSGELIRAVWGKVFKRKVIEDNHIKFDERLVLGEDCVFLLDCFRCANVVQLKNLYLYNYRIREDSTVHSVPKTLENQYIWQLIDIQKSLSLWNDFKEKEFAFTVAVLGCLRGYISNINRMEISFFEKKRKLKMQMMNPIYNVCEFKPKKNFNLYKREKLGCWLVCNNMVGVLLLIYK